MDKQLVRTLLRVFHSEETRFSAGKGLLHFCEIYGVGQLKGASILLTDKDKAEIGAVLKGKLGIDARTTFPGSWDRLSRAESMNLGNDEKLSGSLVGEGRVQVKAMCGHELSVCGGRWVLPERADMGLDLGALLAAPIGHGSLLIVENRQTFIELWRVRKDLLEEVSRTNPLVVFRGDAETGSRADATHRLIRSTDLPVFAFVDFDPAGMVIAAGLPRLDKLVSPNFDELGRLIRDHGLSERFMSQVAAPKMALEKLESDKVVGLVLRVIMKASKGLPQEFFHRGGISP